MPSMGAIQNDFRRTLFRWRFLIFEDGIHRVFSMFGILGDLGKVQALEEQQAAIQYGFFPNTKPNLAVYFSPLENQRGTFLQFRKDARTDRDRVDDFSLELCEFVILL